MAKTNKQETSEEFIQTPTAEELKKRETDIFGELGVITVQLTLLDQQKEMLEQRRIQLVNEQRQIVEFYNKSIQLKANQSADSQE